MSWSYSPTEPAAGDKLVASWGTEVSKAIGEIHDEVVTEITSDDESVSITQNGNTVDLSAGSGMPDADEVEDYKVLQAKDGEAVWDWVRAHS